jgi:hypothetical protein
MALETVTKEAKVVVPVNGVTEGGAPRARSCSSPRGRGGGTCRCTPGGEHGGSRVQARNSRWRIDPLGTYGRGDVDEAW